MFLYGNIISRLNVCVSMQNGYTVLKTNFDNAIIDDSDCSLMLYIIENSQNFSWFELLIRAQLHCLTSILLFLHFIRTIENNESHLTWGICVYFATATAAATTASAISTITTFVTSLNTIRSLLLIMPLTTAIFSLLLLRALCKLSLPLLLRGASVTFVEFNLYWTTASYLRVNPILAANPSSQIIRNSTTRWNHFTSVPMPLRLQSSQCEIDDGTI